MADAVEEGGAAGAAAEVVPAPEAPAGAGDPTRRWALRFGRGAPGFAGVTPDEADRAARWLAGLGEAGRRRALVEVALPVVLSGGAGPWMIGEDGRLVLGLGTHPRGEGWVVAMGPPAPVHPVGIVRREGAGWVWVVRAQATPGAQVAALDALAALGDEAAARAFEEGRTGDGGVA